MLRSGLAILDYKKGELSPTEALPENLAEVITERALHENSEKLGHWFGLLTPFELSTILKVAF